MAKAPAVPPHWQRGSSSGGGALPDDAARPGQTAADNALLAWVSQVLAGGLAGRQPKLVISVKGLLQKAIRLLPPEDRAKFFTAIRLFKKRGHAGSVGVDSPLRRPAKSRKPVAIKKPASTKKKTVPRRK